MLKKIVARRLLVSQTRRVPPNARPLRHKSQLAQDPVHLVRYLQPEFHQRRMRLLYGHSHAHGGLGESPFLPQNKALVILLGYRMRYASRNIFYPFVQETNLKYLVGLEEPNVAMILVKDTSLLSSRPNRPYKLLLFVHERTQVEQMWDGPGVTLQSAQRDYGADEAFRIHDFYAVLEREYKKLQESPLDADASGTGTGPGDQNKVAIYADVSESRSKLQCSRQHVAIPPFGDDPRTGSNQTSEFANFLTRLPTSTVQPLMPILHRLRLIKSPWEVEQMQHAADITADAFHAVFRLTPTLEWEQQVHALFEYECKKRGAQRLAYVPVLAGAGDRACIIHYTQNNQKIRKSDMMLMDAGAEFNGYAADITRTFPASGRFTPPQRRLYEAVLRVQEQVLDVCRPNGTRTLHDLLHFSNQLMEEEVCRKVLGLKGNVQGVLKWIYPHHIGHWLGMDVHDCAEAEDGMIVDAHGEVKPWLNQQLEEGMALTVEPGVYLPKSLAQRFGIPQEYHDIGIRIEDDVVLRAPEESPLILTEATPKSVKDVEACMSMARPQ